ncbi:AMP-dependent synthetase/ligase [Gryllotalpicola ginsengisoli]|uniref:AMP-dependent synthetase/ligase n=1 Tax=Gryllotalpicola ginsengisoli TaxID=444608 RepID=UPI0003B3B31A|nr:AMP-dependent synthetase/ligase [Gryllotalpicola ginsengisoli]
MRESAIPALVPADPEANTTDLLIERVRQTPDKVLFGIPEGDGWRDVTAAEFLEQVTALAKGFVAAGVQPGDKVGIMSRTRYEWVLVDFAMWFAGGVLVPVYETSSPSQVLWNLTDSGAMSVILESRTHYAAFDEVAGELPNIRNVWKIDLGDLDELAESGADVPDEEIERRRRIAKGSDVATLIYSSGTMGKPKGVVLTHSNFVELSRNAARALDYVLEDDASTVLFITIAHVFARFISVVSVHAGVRVGHQADTKLLMESLQSFRPTFLLMVPRVFEKVYNTAEQIAESGGKGRIFRAAADTAVQYSEAKAKGKVGLGLNLKFKLFDALVFRTLKAKMGGRVKYAVSGSAPLSTRLGHFFNALGVEILEGYGLTETTAPVSVNLPGRYKIGTVGPALPGNAIRIADDGEIEIKGVCVFREYWRNPELTQEAFDDGWFRTGDLGSLDDDGYLSITGRKKEIIVTAGGKNVAPAVLEDRARSNPLIDQIVVVGDQRPFIGALVTLDTEMLPVWLKNNGQDENLSLAEAAQNEAVLAEVQKAIDHANEAVSRAESIRKFTILPTQFTEASGHLTPKLSIKRNVIVKDFAAEIDALYEGVPTRQMSLQG